MLYTNKNEINDILDLVEEIYHNNEDSFRGRRSPKVPMMIADGVAVGDEPTNHESLTKNRAKMLGYVAVYAWSKAYEKGISDTKNPKFIRYARKILRSVGHALNVNPDNISFNK